MARLIVWNLMTLDGYMEGPGHDLSFHSDVWGDELEQLSIAQLRTAGALMFGRRTHDLMASHWSNESGEEAAATGKAKAGGGSLLGKLGGLSTLVAKKGAK